MRPTPDADSATISEFVTLGRVSGVFGVRGWIKVVSETRPRSNIVDDYAHWYLKRRDGWKRVTLLEGRPQGKTLVARLDGIDDRDAALELVGAEIAITRDMLPTADDDEFYWADLLDADVVHVDGTRLGRVSRLFETGANDVLVVRDERDGVNTPREILVPWVRPDVVVEVDVPGRRLVVDWDPDF